MPEKTEREHFFRGASQLLEDRISFDDKIRRSAARDQSFYRILPEAVAYPRDEEELSSLIRLAAEHGVPLAARGGGSGTGGAALSAPLESSRRRSL